MQRVIRGRSHFHRPEAQNFRRRWCGLRRGRAFGGRARRVIYRRASSNLVILLFFFFFFFTSLFPLYFFFKHTAAFVHLCASFRLAVGSLIYALPPPISPCYEVTDPITNRTVAIGGYSCDTACESWSVACYQELQAALALVPTAQPGDLAIAAG